MAPTRAPFQYDPSAASTGDLEMKPRSEAKVTVQYGSTTRTLALGVGDLDELTVEELSARVAEEFAVPGDDAAARVRLHVGDSPAPLEPSKRAFARDGTVSWFHGVRLFGGGGDDALRNGHLRLRCRGGDAGCGRRHQQ